MWQQFSVRILASPTLPPKKALRWRRHLILPFYVVLQIKKKGYQSQRSASILVIYGLRPVNKSVKL